MAGVCAGFGRQFGIDPVLIRITLAVVTIFTGAGLILYAGAWLLIPDESLDRSMLDRQLGRWRNRTNNTLLLGGVLLFAVLLASVITWGAAWWSPLLCIMLVMALVALSRRKSRAEAERAAQEPATSATAPSSPVAAPAEPATEPTTASTSGAPSQPTAEPPAPEAATVPNPVVPTQPLPAAEPDPSGPALSGSGPSDSPAPDRDKGAPDPEAIPLGTWRAYAAQPPPGSFWDAPDPLGLEQQRAAEEARDLAEATTGPTVVPGSIAAQPPARRSRMLFPITVCSALIVVGALGAAAHAGLGLTPPAYVAAALGVVGIGLLFGGRYGRAGGLVVVGILLTLALVPMTLASAAYSNVIDLPTTSLAPTSRAEVSGSHQIGSGHYHLDLRRVPFDESTVATDINVGLGEIVVVVPRDVDVNARVDIGLGELNLLGRTTDQPGGSRTVVDRGPDGRGGGTLDLGLNVGLGEVTVRRVP